MTDSLFRDMAKALGLSYDEMAAEYSKTMRYSAAHAYERRMQAIEREAKLQRAATRYVDAIYDQFVIQAMFAAVFQLPHPQEVHRIVGYHPQRLLEHKPEITTTRSTVRHEDGSIESLTVTRGVMRTYEKSEPWPFEKFFHRDLGEEYISFSDMPKLTRYYIEGGHFDMYDREPRRLAPFVTPTGRTRYAEPPFKPIRISNVRLSYPHIEPSEAMKEGAKSHMAIIAGADYASIERQILASMYAPSVRCLVLDLDSPGGEMRGNPQQELYASLLGGLKPIHDDVVDTAAGKRDKSYLKHDPSKSHKRRKRK